MAHHSIVWVRLHWLRHRDFIPAPMTQPIEKEQPWLPNPHTCTAGIGGPFSSGDACLSYIMILLADTYSMY